MSLTRRAPTHKGSGAQFYTLLQVPRAFRWAGDVGQGSNIDENSYENEASRRPQTGKNKQKKLQEHLKKNPFQDEEFGEIPSAWLDSHQNSVQNGMVESFPAATATIFMNFLDFCFEGVSLGGLSGRSLGNLWEV